MNHVAYSIIEAAARDSKAHFGTTSPCLMISKSYGIDYSVPLLICDEMIHGRKAPTRTLDALGMDLGRITLIINACHGVAAQYAFLSSGGKL